MFMRFLLFNFNFNTRNYFTFVKILGGNILPKNQLNKSLVFLFLKMDFSYLYSILISSNEQQTCDI